MFRFTMVGFIVFFGGHARAEPLHIERMGVAYWTDSDSIEMRVQFDRVPSFPADYFSLGLVADRPVSQREWVTLAQGGIGESLRVFHHVAVFPSTIHTFKGEYPYLIDSTTWSATIPFDVTGLDDVPPSFFVTVLGDGEPVEAIWELQGTPVQIDELIMAAPVPEPSGMALASFAALGLFGSRRWLRKKR